MMGEMKEDETRYLTDMQLTWDEFVAWTHITMQDIRREQAEEQRRMRDWEDDDGGQQTLDI